MKVLKYISFAFVLALNLSVVQLQAMHKTITFLVAARQASRMDETKFKEVAKYAQKFLKENINKLACQTNESGFIRINIPIFDDVKSQFEGIKKIRTNYWAPGTKVMINPESIHTHPTYFESLIIQGGYNHEIYESGDNKDIKYDLYQLLKDGDSKSFVFVGETPLRFIKTEFVQEGTIKIFNKELIHRVMNTTPQTLSLNVVFDEIEEDYTSYNVYLTKHGRLSDIKTTRSILLKEKAKSFIEEIASTLEKAC